MFFVLSQRKHKIVLNVLQLLITWILNDNVWEPAKAVKPCPPNCHEYTEEFGDLVEMNWMKRYDERWLKCILRTHRAPPQLFN